MKKQLLTYGGLFGDDSGVCDHAFLHHEPLQARSFRYGYKIEEHLHTGLVQLFLITSGGGLLLSSGMKIPLASPSILIIPSNRLHGFVFQDAVRGEVFTVPESSFDGVVRSAPSVFSQFEQLRYFPLDAGADSFVELLELKTKIVRETQRTDETARLSLKLLFQLFLLTLHRLKRADREGTIESDDRVLRHFNRFNGLLKKYVHEGKPVSFYAREMNLTPVHLNRICQAVARRTALQVIHDRVMMEAKKYLNGTGNTVSEIAYFLGFKDPAHFSKFFKKKEGVPPGVFRKQNAQSSYDHE